MREGKEFERYILTLYVMVLMDPMGMAWATIFHHTYPGNGVKIVIATEYLGGRRGKYYVTALQAEVNGETLECKSRGARGHYSLRALKKSGQSVGWSATDA